MLVNMLEAIFFDVDGTLVDDDGRLAFGGCGDGGTSLPLAIRRFSVKS